MTAWGEEANFGYPARPAPPIWVVKVRYRSATSAILGQVDPYGDQGERQKHQVFQEVVGLFPSQRENMAKPLR